MTSEGFSGGSPADERFPYPVTENWQKAIGGFNFGMSADVSATNENGMITYKMILTIHAEDKYNFNPGQQDIATETPDAVNGVFELVGLGHQFMQYGTYTEIVTRSKQSNNSSTQEKPKEKKEKK